MYDYKLNCCLNNLNVSIQNFYEPKVKIAHKLSTGYEKLKTAKRE